MAAYFQMGHDTENLVGEQDLEEFAGIILSPINRDPGELKGHIDAFREKGNYNIVFDSQLYFPRANRGKLHEHPYFPSDIDTADIQSETWWENISKELSEYVKGLKVNTVVSPVVLPKIWNNDYFDICSKTSRKLRQMLNKSGIKVITTFMVSMKQLTDEKTILSIASIISKEETDGYYLVFDCDVDPRRELADPNEVLGAMLLIKELTETKRDIIVSHCSSDMILYKAAGATHCATNKFFNLRRFTKSRYQEPVSGGGQVAYWFEHSLLAFLRQGDIERLQKNGYTDLLETLYSMNYWGKQILEQLENKPDEPLVGLGWRQYLAWFGKTEYELSVNLDLKTIEDWLRIAESNWLALEDNHILFFETRNDGHWIRPWRQAFYDFLKKAGL